MNERLLDPASRPPATAPPRTAPPSFAPSTPPPPPPRAGIHPLAFIGTLVGALLIGLGLLFIPEKESTDLTDAEVQALVHAASPGQPSSATRWETPTRPSTLHLTTEPVGATVLLDGTRIGVTPIELGNLRPDFYRVTLQLPDHAPLDTAIYLASSSVFALNVAMESLFPADESDEPLELPDETFRENVAASTDAMPVEPVPATRRETPSSTPSARVTQPGTPSGGGSTAPRPAPEPPPSFQSASPEVLQRVSHTGSLSVSSSPAGAEVLVDGVPHGQAPLSLSGLRPGFYVVTLTLPGRTPVSYRAEVTAQAVSVVKGAFPTN